MASVATPAHLGPANGFNERRIIRPIRLDLDRAERVLDYLHKVWRRPIKLETIDAAGQPRTLSRAAA